MALSTIRTLINPATLLHVPPKIWASGLTNNYMSPRLAHYHMSKLDLFQLVSDQDSNLQPLAP